MAIACLQDKWSPLNDNPLWILIYMFWWWCSILSWLAYTSNRLTVLGSVCEKAWLTRAIDSHLFLIRDICFIKIYLLYSSRVVNINRTFSLQEGELGILCWCQLQRLCVRSRASATVPELPPWRNTNILARLQRLRFSRSKSSLFLLLLVVASCNNNIN